MRLDEALVARKFFPSRSRARDAVLRGTVSVGGAICRKPAQAIAETDTLTVDDPARAYVSRAAIKLIAGLDAFGFDPAGCHALDIGASTGGFTQVLLERNAAHVIALDVGHGQLVEALHNDRRVSVLEGLNARDLSETHLGSRRPDALVSDVSFISLTLALPPALALAATGAWGVFLVKPQFEAGREAIGKGGILRDPAAGEGVAQRIHDWLDIQPGWRASGLILAPIEGGDGNQEYLLGGRKDQ